MTERTYTVKQAARLLAVSEMTVRRLAHSGAVPATRAGRQWVLDADAVDARVRVTSRASAARPSLDFESALRQVLEARAKEWIPDPLGFADLKRTPDLVLAGARRRWEGAMVDGEPYEQLPVPKTVLLHRPGVRLTLADEVIYQALALKCAPAIRATLSEAACGYRPAEDGGRLLERTEDAWSRYQGRLREAPERWAFALQTDIAAYFEHIQPIVLRDTLLTIGIPPDIVGGIQGLLAGWNRTMGVGGLPQGGDASRLLGNAYLHAVDDALDAAARAHSWQYLRWMDDITVFAADEESLRAASFLLQTALRRLGLSLSSAKTKVRPAREVADEATDPVLGQIDYAFRTRRYDAVRRDAWPVLRRATGNLRHIHPEDGTELRFALYRLGISGDSRAIPFLARVLPDAGFLADFAFLYLRHFASDRRVIDAVTRTLVNADLARDSYLAAHLCRVLCRSGALPNSAVDAARRLAWTAEAPASFRAPAIRVLGRHGTAADQLDLRTRLWSESHDVCIRAILAAVRETDPRGYRSILGDFRRLRPQFKTTVDYLLAAPAPPLP